MNRNIILLITGVLESRGMIMIYTNASLQVVFRAIITAKPIIIRSVRAHGA